jgi:two-component sensor histidine kinase
VALRESQERLKAVVAELQHRTRNLIGIVGTIAKRTLKTSKTFDHFEASFQDRLEVLGRTQGLLSGVHNRHGCTNPAWCDLPHIGVWLNLRW